MMPMDVHTHQALGLDQPTPKAVNGHSNADIVAAPKHAGDAPYDPCPETYPGLDVGAGTVTTFADWNESKIFSGTIRDVAVYSPPGSEPMDPGGASAAASIQHSFEYDSLTPGYGHFICRELLPFVADELKLTISGSRAHRTICGFSNGGHRLRHGGALFADSLRWLRR